jgi:hypothetical protein
MVGVDGFDAGRTVRRQNGKRAALWVRDVNVPS